MTKWWLRITRGRNSMEEGDMRLLDMHAHLACLMEGWEAESLRGPGLKGSLQEEDSGGPSQSPASIRDRGQRNIQESQGQPSGKKEMGVMRSEAGACADEKKVQAALAELAFRRREGIGTFFSCGTPGEWEFMQRLREDNLSWGWKTGLPGEETGLPPGKEGLPYGESSLLPDESMLHVSFGIHPWHSDSYDPEEWMECFRACDAVGEIGMDSVWCEVPLLTQEEVFRRQLEIAETLGKPVILHTKGQEQTIAELVRGFTGKICVHWYSGDIKTFEKFLEQGCYFTLGPDFAANCLASGPLPPDRAPAELYRHMLRRIPDDRIFLETDGVSAVAWACGKERWDIREVPLVLRKNMEFLAEARGVSLEAMQAQIRRNLQDFCGTHSTSLPMKNQDAEYANQTG